MAFSDTEVAQILKFLRYPLKVTQPGFVYYSPLTLSYINNFTADNEDAIRDVIGKLNALEASLVTASEVLIAAGIESIKINMEYIKNLKELHRYWLSQLSTMLALDPWDGDTPMVAGMRHGG